MVARESWPRVGGNIWRDYGETCILFLVAVLVMALSVATVTSVGLTCKAVVALGICSLRVKGLSTLDAALHSQHRHGVLTGPCPTHRRLT